MLQISISRTMLTLLLIATGYFSMAQSSCNKEFKVTTEDSKDGLSSGKIYLSASTGESVTLKLFQIDNTSNKLVSTKTVSTDQLTGKQPVFDNLSAATYLIQCTWSGCTVTVGGIEGLQIKQSQKK
jgi:hypothetical protein